MHPNPAPEIRPPRVVRETAACRAALDDPKSDAEITIESTVKRVMNRLSQNPATRALGMELIDRVDAALIERRLRSLFSGLSIGDLVIPHHQITRVLTLIQCYGNACWDRDATARGRAHAELLEAMYGREEMRGPRTSLPIPSDQISHPAGDGEPE